MRIAIWQGPSPQGWTEPVRGSRGGIRTDAAARCEKNRTVPGTTAAGLSFNEMGT